MFGCVRRLRSRAIRWGKGRSEAAVACHNQRGLAASDSTTTARGLGAGRGQRQRRCRSGPPWRSRAGIDASRRRQQWGRCWRRPASRNVSSRRSAENCQAPPPRAALALSSGRVPAHRDGARQHERGCRRIEPSKSRRGLAKAAAAPVARASPERPRRASWLARCARPHRSVLISVRMSLIASADCLERSTSLTANSAPVSGWRATNTAPDPPRPMQGPRLHRSTTRVRSEADADAGGPAPPGGASSPATGLAAKDSSFCNDARGDAFAPASGTEPSLAGTAPGGAGDDAHSPIAPEPRLPGQAWWGVQLAAQEAGRTVLLMQQASPMRGKGKQLSGCGLPASRWVLVQQEAEGCLWQSARARHWAGAASLLRAWARWRAHDRGEREVLWKSQTPHHAAQAPQSPPSSAL